MSKEKLDICCVSEVTVTKTKYYDDQLHRIKGFKRFFPNSWNKHGHSRLILYVRESLHEKIQVCRSKMSKDQPDIWIKIKLKTGHEGKQDVFIGFYYREWKGIISGNNSQADQVLRLQEFLESAKFFVEKGETWILGDINVDYNKITRDENLNEVDKTWRDFLVANAMDQLIFLPTRCRMVLNTKQESLIDHIVTNRRDLASNIKITKTSTSDHAIVSMTRATESRFAPEKITVRSYRNLNPNDFNADLAKQDWSAMDGNDVDAMEAKLTSAISNCLDKHAPKISFTPKAKRVNLSKEIVDEIAQRDLAFERFKRTGLPEDKREWKMLKNRVTGLVRKEKDKDELKGYGNQTKAWKVLKEIEKKSDDSGPPTRIKEKGKLVKDKAKIAEILNKHFVTKTEKNIEEIENVKRSSPEQIECPSVLFKRTLPQECEPWGLETTTEEEVAKIIDDLKPTSGEGADHISNKALKLAKPTILKPLTKLINTSIATGSFPKKWRIGLVTPLFKKKDKLEPDNYRAISILSKTSLILEKIVNNQFKEICRRYNLIDKNQHSYSIGKGCDTALVSMYHRWLSATNKGDFVGILMTDMRDAFGLINGSIFDKKLKCVNASHTTRRWFRSYLSNRKQMTKIGTKVSSLRELPSGLPQGSVLACLGFLFFTSDLPKCLTHSIMDNFADDSTSTVSGKDPKEVTEKLEADATRISNYMISNSLLLAPEKTVLMLAANKQKERSDETKKLSIKVGGFEIKQSRTARILGLTINADLTQNDFLFGIPENRKEEKGLIKSLADRLNMIERLKNCPLKTKKMFISSLFGGKLNYCLAVWGGLPKGQLETLQAMQYRAARMATGKSRWTSRSDLLRQCKWLNIEHQIKKQTIRILYTIRQNDSIPYLSKFIGRGRNPFASKIPTYETDQTKLFSRSFVPRACKYWNDLPQQIRECPPNSFKRELHKHLFDSQFES